MTIVMLAFLGIVLVSTAVLLAFNHLLQSLDDAGHVEDQWGVSVMTPLITLMAFSIYEIDPLVFYLRDRSFGILN